jgi:hypothetical protein
VVSAADPYSSNIGFLDRIWMCILLLLLVSMVLLSALKVAQNICIVWEDN